MDTVLLRNIVKIAIYLRVSTEDQAENGVSLHEQKERLLAYCKAQGWPEPTLYEDDGYSAKDLRRPALKQLLEDVKTHGYTTIITTKLDRLSRRLFDILSIIDYLEKYDCNYISASESFDTTTPAGRLTLQLLGMVAEFERERISENVRFNMLSIARKGEKIITRPCFGYDVFHGIRVINVEEALIVQKMADWALEGKGPREIAKRLNEMGVKTKSGKQWHDRVVRELLRRRTLIGEFVYNQTYKKGTRTITRPKEEWIIVENNHPPILDKDTFYSIQRIFDSRKVGASRHVDSDRYLLTGLLTCGHCGSPMVGQTTKKTTKTRVYHYFRYACNAYAKKGTCFYHNIIRDDLENDIINRIRDIASNLPQDQEFSVMRKSSATDEREVILSRLKRLDQKAQKQIEAYEDDLISSYDLKMAMERIEREREALNDSLIEIDKLNKENALVHDQARKLLNDVLSFDRIKVKTAIRQLVHNVVIMNGSEASITWYA